MSKHCKDCLYVLKTTDIPQFWRCLKFFHDDEVTGERDAEYCAICRLFEEKCGHEGKHFKDSYERTIEIQSGGM